MVLSSMDLASSDASDPEASPAIQIAVSCHLTGYTRPFPLPLTVKSRVAMFSRLACLVAAMTFSAIVAAESDSTQLAVATATLTRNTRRTLACQPSKSMSNEILLHLTHQVFSVQAPSPACKAESEGVATFRTRALSAALRNHVLTALQRTFVPHAHVIPRKNLPVAAKTHRGLSFSHAHVIEKKIRVLPPSHGGLPFKHAHV